MPPGDSGKALLRILVRSPNWLGDAVMSFPAVEALQRAFPRARIDALAPQNLAVLWEQHPAVASVVKLDPKASPWKTGQALRSRGYDLGILFPNSFRSALELWWARAPMRVGYAGQWRRTLLTHPVERGPDWFPTRPLSEKQAAELVQNAKSPNRRAKPPSGAHHVFQYLRLAAALGADVKPAPPRLTLSEGQVRAALRKLNLPLEPEPPWVALHPGAAYGEAKQWFPDRFLETAALVHKQRPCRWLIIGGEEERSLTRWLSTKLAQTLASRPSRPGAVAVHEPVIHLGGKTSLMELAAALSQCRLFLGNDSGPMHLAAALGVPVAAVFGSTSATISGPGLPGDPRHRAIEGAAPCAPCFRKTCPIDHICMRAVEPAQVAAAALDLLAESKR